ncbi:protein kinase [Kineosporia rhizophila]|uniref:serine/threonine-protein kinase n=1 Tax=Kineosporia rhizophila TaxID=84633 RepID=UPI001E4EE8AF|nr:serine/threonine-protein kinase [Kineosporia rhizophila]MCE0540067.1 protein kinase [Kineosporia rhizophila]
MPLPELIGRYRPVRRLGSGGFAVVWLAHDESLDAEVAVKVMADNWADRLDLRERFLGEARMLRQAASQRIVQVFDIGELEDGRPYLVMEYADAGTLADRVKANGAYPLAEALRITAEVARGVAELHDAGVVHRDLKPSNVLIKSRRGGGERLLVADLGVAKSLAHGSGVTMSVGSAGYMAPEQMEPQIGVDVRADVYSLGAFAFYLMTAQKPYLPLVMAEKMPAALPRPVLQTMLSALERDRENRWPDAGSLAERFDQLAAQLPEDFSVAAVRPPAESPTPTPSSPAGNNTPDSPTPGWTYEGREATGSGPNGGGAAGWSDPIRPAPARSGSNWGQPASAQQVGAFGTADPTQAGPTRAAAPAAHRSTPMPSARPAGQDVTQPLGPPNQAMAQSRSRYDSNGPQNAAQAFSPGYGQGYGSGPQAHASGHQGYAPGNQGNQGYAPSHHGQAGQPGHPGQGARPASSSSGRSNGPGRARWIATMVLVVALAAATGVGAVRYWQTRGEKDITAESADGVLRLTVPSGFGDESVDTGWAPASIGLKGKQEPSGLLLAEDVKLWSDLTQDVNGVFVGLSTSKDLPGKVEAIKHQDCEGSEPVAYSGERWEGSYRTWNGCSGGERVLQEVHLKAVDGDQWVYMQIRQSSDTWSAQTVIEGLELQ